MAQYCDDRSLSVLACGVAIYGGTLLAPAAAASAKDGEAVFTAADADVKTAVTRGTGKMKPVAGVAGADLDNLIAFVHTLKK